MVAELDALLAKLKPPDSQQSFQFAAKRSGRPDVLKTIESALQMRKRAYIEYRAASRNGAATAVHIEPLILKLAERPYVRAYCVERDAERTYKLDRIARIELTNEPATYRSKNAQTFARAVKVWTGEPVVVRVRLDPDVAWRAEEYPLIPEQKLVYEPDGSALLEACVAGVVETAHWVLGWGGAAEALGPPELRDRVSRELAKALEKYERRPGPAKARRTPREQKSTARETGRLTQAGTRGA
jgi:proteasome accessory factor C